MRISLDARRGAEVAPRASTRAEAFPQVDPPAAPRLAAAVASAFEARGAAPDVAARAAEASSRAGHARHQSFTY